MAIFSATQRCNIVATLFRMVTTLFQNCISVLREKSSLRIVPCKIALKLPETSKLHVLWRKCRSRVPVTFFSLFSLPSPVKVMLHGRIHNDDFWRNTTLQYWNNVAAIRNNVATMMQRCVVLKIVVANRFVWHVTRCYGRRFARTIFLAQLRVAILNLN